MLTKEKIEKEISNENLKTVKIITFALNIGVILFAFVCLFLYLNGEGNSNDTQLLDILLGVLFLVASTSYGLSAIIPKKVLVENLKQENPNLIGALTNYQIMKLAMFEAPALFGLVIIILGITNKVIYTNDYIFIAIAPLIAMVALSIITFPSEFRVKSFFKSILDEIQLNKNFKN
ncbi:MAG: hypothetical protein H6609_01370 [Ignavibacteriales bacterium]|nr:hypothetical protein [Ignavibacteriales bacterium]